MGVDSALVVGVRVLPVVGDARYGGELQPGLVVEVRVTSAGVDRSVPDAEVGETVRLIRADRNIHIVAIPPLLNFGLVRGASPLVAASITR